MVYFTKVNSKSNHEDFRGVLKTKENIFHHKCKKSLKNKLKKYKLRRDGQEDPAILDVSSIFHQSLRIDSPTKKSYFNNNINEWEEYCTPLNYISKMVRKKGNVLSEANRENITGDKNVLNEEPERKDTNAKKQNAFHVMMLARNKSIGSNSPGKDYNSEENSDETLEKKKTKLKRNLLLQKFAEAKGAAKNKELDAKKEEYIKQKMDERAERLRNMVTKGEKISKTKVKKTTFISNPKIPDSPGISSLEETSIKIIVKKPVLSEKLTMNDKKSDIKEIDIFSKLNNEDAEFLKKLSPSIKKKQSMLSYFNKVEKESECIVVDEEVMETEESTQALLKVKLPKSKKKNKKKKLSLKKNVLDQSPEKKLTEPDMSSVKTISESVLIVLDTADDIIVAPTENTNSVDVKEPKEKNPRKRKHSLIVEIAEHTPSITDKSAVDEPKTFEGRPKRHIKKPIKYEEDEQLSSDDDCHIITPKKKKRGDNKVINTDSGESKDIFKGKIKNEVKSKTAQTSKLAPVFGVKMTLDAAALEARQRFLQSGIPEKMKKTIAQAKAQQEISAHFIPVTHVQQINSNSDVQLASCILKYKVYPIDSDVTIDESAGYKQFLHPQDSDSKIAESSSNSKIDINIVLKNMKETYPEFPIFRTYRRLLHKSKGEHRDIVHINVDDSAYSITDVSTKNTDPSSLNWTEKYRASSTKQIMGNFEAVKEVKKWLVSWTEAQVVTTKHGSDSDFWQSDGDSRDSMRSSKNLLVLHGPVGSGKTSCVYAAAAELAVKVIEVNASSRRTGKILLQGLHEATQSHKVNRGKGSSAENSQNSQELSHRGRGRKSLKKMAKLAHSGLQQSSQGDGRTGMSLILIDDADVAFEQDDGFVAAIAQLVHSSKRPLILVTSSLTCPHLQRFVCCENIVKMSPLSPRILGTWLDLLCLVDSRICWPGLGAQVLDHFNGDIRKTVNFVQFLAISEAKMCDSVEEDATLRDVEDVDDENSSQSWSGDGSIKNAPQVLQLDIKKFKGYVGRELSYPLDTVSVWWSIPTMVKTTSNATATELDNISRLLDDISLVDCLCGDGKRSAEITLSPWKSPVSDSVSEREHLDYRCGTCDMSEEISYELVKRSLANLGTVRSEAAPMSFPGLFENRRQTKIIARHESVSRALLPPAVDRRSLALDYWPLCRAVCRAERARTDNNTRRHNRFHHYLKTPRLGGDVLDKLADSLC